MAARRTAAKMRRRWRRAGPALRTFLASVRIYALKRVGVRVQQQHLCAIVCVCVCARAREVCVCVCVCARVCVCI